MRMTKLYLFVKRFLPIVLLASCFTMALGQGRTVSGKVTSGDDGSSVPGVNIIEKGTSNGTVTDADGNYRIVAYINPIVSVRISHSTITGTFLDDVNSWYR